MTSNDSCNATCRLVPPPAQWVPFTIFPHFQTPLPAAAMLQILQRFTQVYK